MVKPSNDKMEYRMNLEEERRLLALERQHITTQMKEMVDTTRTYLNRGSSPLQAQTCHPAEEHESTPSMYVCLSSMILGQIPIPLGRHSLHIMTLHVTKVCYSLIIRYESFTESYVFIKHVKFIDNKFCTYFCNVNS